MKDFRYKTVFASKIRCLMDSEKDKFLAQASLKSLKGIIPDSVREQESLMAVAFNAFVGNLANKNGAMVDTDVSIDIHKKFINTPINKDHSRVGSYGHIVSAGFSTFDINYANGAGSEILDIKDVKGLTSPFNVCLAGVLYRLYDPKLIEYIEESNDPNSTHYMDISASFELLFDEFHLAVGSKYLEECEIIKDEKKISELSKYLLDEGGSGRTPEGKIISRLIIGSVIPAGIGLTNAPAAELAGIVTDSERTKISIKSSENEDISAKSTVSTNGEIDKNNETHANSEHFINKCSCGEIISQCRCMGNKKEVIVANGCEKCKKSENSNSHKEIIAVKDSKDNIKSNKIMLKTRKDITDEALKEANASQVLTVLDTEIEKISKDWEDKKGAVEKELKASNDKLTEAEKKIKENEDKLAQVQENLNKLVEANEKREQEEIFNTRMNYFDSEYDLSEEKTRNIVARKIKSAATEDQYKEQKEEIELLLAAKKKAAKKDEKMMTDEEKEEMKKKMEKEKMASKASVDNKEENTEGIVDQAIDNGEKTKTTVAATTAPTETLGDKFNKAFGKDNWEIDSRILRKR